MIPTSVTNSPPAAGLAQNGGAAAVAVVVVGGGGGAASTAAAAAAAQQQSNYNSIVLGLASLILEGRPIADDEYQLQVPPTTAQTQQQQQQQQSSSSSSGRHSPRPSTSRAAINITTNPYAHTPGARSSSYGYAYSPLTHAPIHTSYDYGHGQSTSATHQRWTQKLCQLRQLSPAAQSMSVEPELVSLAINDLNAERGDFEIVRRVMLNHAGGGGGMGMGMGVGGATGGEQNSSAASSPSSVSSTDNILHSLQSLATTCLRGAPATNTNETRPLSLSIGYGSPTAAATAATATAAASAAHLFDYNCGRTSDRWGSAIGGGVYGGSRGGVGATTTTTSTATASNNIATGTGIGTSSSSNCNTTTTTTTRPKHGPHCDQFLRKMGLAKGESSTDAEEHFCDMSYVNITCSRWRAHCMKMEAILARREPVCIEVFLGPAGHKILLEQWIISGKEKVPPPTMTLPSLCSAIRSQLYFSQIVAWCDLLRKCDPSVYDSGRVIFASSNSTTAGDLASSTGTSSSTTGSRRPRLNIFYRIRPYDPNSSASSNDQGFSAKSNVHNFPNVNIAENFSVAVCVKSLPRFNGGLPHVAPPTPAPTPQPKSRPVASTPTGGGGMCAATPTGLGARIVQQMGGGRTTPSTGTSSSSSSCDKYDRSRGRRQEEEELDAVPVDELDGHRERQLQKYRKRMQRRDKKRERKPSDDPLMDEHMVDAMDEGGSEDGHHTTRTQSPAHPTPTTTMTLIPPPRRRIAMISTGTQTSLSSCQQCGSEKTLLCLNCSADERQGEDGDTSASEMEEISTSSSCSLSSSDLIVGTPRNKAELLLQAIQRTPKNRKITTTTITTTTAHKDLNLGCKPAAPTTTTTGCHECKRQKTQHNYGRKSGGGAGGRAGGGEENGSNGHGDDNSMEQEVEQISSTKLTPNLDRCSLNGSREKERCQTPPDTAMDDEQIVVQFKTPNSHVPLKLQEPTMTQSGQPLSKASSQLRLNCNGGGNLMDRETPPSMLSPLSRKALPKVNLNTIFCSSSSSSPSSAPISIDSSLAFCFGYAHTQSQSLLTPPESHQSNLHVQKSYSAPTLPNALSVSPRFAKQAAFYKRRSRHLSDRSDRSSLGSDEQLSDEDLESGMCSPAGSPLKGRARLGIQFGGRPLLGNLEESLLQKRLLPKIEVPGFRLQLGASGVFCPKQRTIPASAYFYELHGETLSTPYLCEIRLPRKGYSVPLMGTVQATLLNPMGTVVRMFVIPYDMRDMPNLHRTFIRQRILADELPCNGESILQQQQRVREREPGSPTVTTSTTSKLGHFISAEQMKRLRYSIHLRFQTSRSGRLSLHTDIRLLISRRTDCDTAAAHAKGLVEAPNELVTDTLMPTEPRYSARQESPGKI